MTFNPITVPEFRARIAQEGAAAVARDLRDRAELAKEEDHAFIAIDKTAFAKIGDKSSGGALAGVPIAVKDNIDALPLPTTGASPALLDNQPRADAPVVTRLRTAGAVIIGKTSLHELAFGITSNNAHFGAIPNPFDRKRVAGGSSGGSAVVLARGVVPMALGSDTGGSSRIPAAFCNVVGLRPTMGRYPGEGVLNLSPTRDTIGPMATTVQDVAALDAVITGEGAYILDERPIRLGVLSNARSGLSKATDAAVDRALAQLREAGFDLVSIDFTEVDQLHHRIDGVIAFHEILQVWTHFTRDRLGLTLDEFAARVASPDVREAFAQIKHLAPDLEREYPEAVNTSRPRFQQLYDKLFGAHRVDALITATVPVPPPLIGEDTTMTVDGVVLPTFPTVIRNASPASVAGIPSLSVPGGFDANGMPVGLLLECKARQDRRLLAIGETVQAALAPLRRMNR